MILCIDTNERELIAMGELLRTREYTPFLCIDPADALRALAYQQIEVVVAGEVLNSPAGRAILNKARSFMPRIPLIYWAEAPISPQAVAALDPDVILSRSEGTDELLRIISILQQG